MKDFSFNESLKSRYKQHAFFFAFCTFLATYSKYLAFIFGTLAISLIAFITFFPNSDRIFNLLAVISSLLSLILSMFDSSSELKNAAKVRMFLEHKYYELLICSSSTSISPENAIKILSKLQSIERKMWERKTDIIDYEEYEFDIAKELSSLKD